MNTESKNQVVMTPEKTKRIVWQTPQLTEASIEDITHSSLAGTTTDAGLSKTKLAS